ncbi:MAG: hypothetical protein U0694_08775 [Anaerolineae bacterium]
MSLLIPRKWTLRAHGARVVFVKGLNESSEHVLMKAYLWALYLPQYPRLTVEIRVGDKYKPDVVQMDEGKPSFWGESGQVSVEKIRSLARRYRRTHFAIAKWDMRLDWLEATVREALEGLDRSAPFDLLSFPPNSFERFIDKDGTVNLSHEDVEWLRL